jgi:hypothetical protein
MKQLFLFLAILLVSETAFAQDNNLIWTMTANVKMDKRLEWEKKMVAFVKTHMPNAKFRVWEVISGERTGSYVIIVGPTNFKEWDQPNVSPKGEALMKADGQALDALCNWTRNSYWRGVSGLETSNPNRKLKYQVATYSVIEMGTWGDVSPILGRIKESREKAGVKYDGAVLRPTMSGPGNAFLSIRWVENLEELDNGGGPFGVSEKYDELFGNNSFYKDINSYMSMIKSNTSELRMLRRDLSSM